MIINMGFEIVYLAFSTVFIDPKSCQILNLTILFLSFQKYSLFLALISQFRTGIP